MHWEPVTLFYIIFITMFSIASQNSIRNDNKHQQSTDIFVEAIAVERILQLNITILKALESNFEIEILTVQKDGTKHCMELQNCLVHSGSLNQQSIIIPAQAEYLTDREPCIFQNDCTYNITVKTYDDAFDESIIYHTRECIGSVCACKHTDQIPIPKIQTSINNWELLNVKWKLNRKDLLNLPKDIQLQYLTIDIYELNSCNNTSWKYKSVGTSHERLVHNDLKLRFEGDYTKKLDHNITSECLRVRMNVVDSQNCIGKQNESLVMIPKRESNNQNNFTVQFVLISLFCMLLLCSIILLSVYGYIWWNRKKNIIKYWRGIYNNNPPNGSSNQMIPMRENPLYLMRDSQEEDCFEIPPSAIKEIGREIGKGAFGRVYIARMSEIPGIVKTQIVAIKKLKKHPTPEQLEEFLSEISTMKRVGKHPNIVRLLGSCMVEQGLMMVMEYVPCGDLLKYLRVVRAKLETASKVAQHESQLSNNNSNCSNNLMRHSTSSQTILGPLGKYLDILHSHSTSSASETSSYITQPDSLPSSLQIQMPNGTSRPSFAETMYTNLTVPSNPELTPMISSLEYTVDHNELHNFAAQIARGMKHLEERQITHRDLAARNILIDENKNLKISDFGLSRKGIYVNTKNKKVPLRWLSVEAMRDNLYSSKSDVWSFAIVLWEIGTLGGFPYPNIQNHELLNYLKTGQRLERPENCSETLYELMLQCWATDPDDRPNFSDICKKLDPNKSRIYIDFSELSPTYVFPPTSDEFKNHRIKCEKHSKP